VKARRAVSIALAASLLLATAGCSLFATQGTLVHYEPSDGTAADIGDIKLRNVMGLSDNGDDIALVMTLVNSGDSDVNVNVQYEDSTGEKVTLILGVKAQSSVHIGGGGGEGVAILRNAGATVGGLFPVYAQYGTEPGKQLQVPILDGSIAAYSTLIPSPEPTFTAAPTPVPTDPVPTESATPAS
jgi:hypothetical protein